MANNKQEKKFNKQYEHSLDVIALKNKIIG